MKRASPLRTLQQVRKTHTPRNARPCDYSGDLTSGGYFFSNPIAVFVGDPREQDAEADHNQIK